MKKINSLVLSTITAAFLVGCGGGGGGSSTPAGTPSTATDVSVERGAIWGATVTDSSTPAQTATQQSATSNVYTFASAPKYPIKAVGGIIDIDGNPDTEDDVVDFTGKELISYSNVITPITNYLGDITSEEGKSRLAKLKEITGSSEDDLLKKVPSETNKEILALTNALFEILNDEDETNDDFLSDYDNSAFKTKFDELKERFVDGTDLKEIAKIIENEVVSAIGFTKLTSEEVANKKEEIKSSLFTLTQAMISGKEMLIIDEYGEITVQFKADGTYAETFEDFDGSSGTCSGTWAFSKDLKNTLDMNIRCSDNNNELETFKLIFAEEPKNGSKFKLESKDEEDEVYTITTIKNIETSTSGGSSTPTTDSKVTLTKEMFDNKTIEVIDGDEKETLDLHSGGTIFYTWDFPGDSGQCSGTWTVSGNKLDLTTTSCSDNDNSSFSIIFDETPKDGAKVTFVEFGPGEKGTITTFSDLFK